MFPPKSWYKYPWVLGIYSRLQYCNSALRPQLWIRIMRWSSLIYDCGRTAEILQFTLDPKLLNVGTSLFRVITLRVYSKVLEFRAGCSMSMVANYMYNVRDRESIAKVANWYVTNAIGIYLKQGHEYAWMDGVHASISNRVHEVHFCREITCNTQLIHWMGWPSCFGGIPNYPLYECNNNSKQGHVHARMHEHVGMCEGAFSQTKHVLVCDCVR